MMKIKAELEFWFFFWELFLLFFRLWFQLIQLAISRRREFLADASAVSLTKQPSGLISALKENSRRS